MPCTIVCFCGLLTLISLHYAAAPAQLLQGRLFSPRARASGGFASGVECGRIHRKLRVAARFGPGIPVPLLAAGWAASSTETAPKLAKLDAGRVFPPGSSGAAPIPLRGLSGAGLYLGRLARQGLLR